jgi:hypothetical protein
MASFNKFNCFVADVANKVHNLGSDTLKLALTDSAPVATNTVLANITQITAANGYSSGGATVSISSSTQSSGTYKLIPASNPVWTASGGSIAQFRYVVLYNSTPGSGNLIGWWDIGSETNIGSGNTFTPNLDATNGILQLA